MTQADTANITIRECDLWLEAIERDPGYTISRLQGMIRNALSDLEFGYQPGAIETLKAALAVAEGR